MPALLTETSVSAVVEGVSAAGTGYGGILTKIFITGVILFLTVAGAKKWFYPYTVDDLKGQIELVQKIIKENAAVGKNLLGELEWKFQEELVRHYQGMRGIEERLVVEPKRWNLLAWIALRWRDMRDVKRHYDSLIELKRELVMEVNLRKNDVLQIRANIWRNVPHTHQRSPRTLST
ncbi:hypothetical protein PQX77_021671 [Marasmius sp. AFHP31]|nr:hypothetical protein PQX77_021671 [Marasmius sp. AFHP31]